MTIARSLLFILLVFIMDNSEAQPQDANYDEAKVPEYKLPVILEGRNETRVSSKQQWEQKRRVEILGLFAEHMFGKAPLAQINTSFRVTTTNPSALQGKATMKIVAATFTRGSVTHEMPILIFLPNAAVKPVSLFIGLNFNGNHTIVSDPDVPLPGNWVRNSPDAGITDNRATERNRGSASSRWPIEMIVGSGFGVATIYNGDIDPDYDDFSNGVHRLFYGDGQTSPAPDEWGTIGAWAWGLSRAMDYFEQDHDIDQSRVALLGHSRLGKAALWAGAQDERFAIVISNDSGCGGAALSRRRFGETVKRINESFPHWFCDNLSKYNDKEDALPFDQHMLLSLIAPRPVYVASASEDLWADPKGEYLSLYHAQEVYALYGFDPVLKPEVPSIGEPISTPVFGHHIREGGHDITEYDWRQYIAFAKLHFEK